MYSCFAVHFLKHKQSSVFRIIGVTAQPLQHFPFESQIVEVGGEGVFFSSSDN